MASRLLLGGLLSLVMASGGSTPKTTNTFAVVGVYMDEANPSSYNTHVVGTWALNIDLAPDSNTAQVQRAAQDQCAKTAPKKWKCAEMGQWNLDKNNRRSKPCAAIALGMYRGVHDDGVSHAYTLWPSKQGFNSSGEAERWGRAELRRLPQENNNDEFLREISISTTCAAPGS